MEDSRSQEAGFIALHAIECHAGHFNVNVMQVPAPQQPPKLSLVTLPCQRPLQGQVLVHMTLRPINHIDLIDAHVCHNLHQPPAPTVPGYEGFGIVESVGENVRKLQVGQRVVPFLWTATLQGRGSWQQYVVVAEEDTWPVPAEVTDEAAAQFVVNGWASYGLVEDLKIPRGEFLLQTAAGSALARNIINMAKQYWHIKTINIVRHRHDADSLRLNLHADHVIVLDETPDIAHEVCNITNGKMAYGAIDTVGGDVTQKVCASVRCNGEVFVCGNLGGHAVVSVNYKDLAERGVKLTGWRIGHCWNDKERRERFIREVGECLKTMKPSGTTTFHLSEFAKALEHFQKGKGRVLLRS